MSLFVTLYTFFSGTTWLSPYQKGKTSLRLNEARDDGVWGWQLHQLDHMRTICTSLQTNISSVNVYRPNALPDAQLTASKQRRHVFINNDKRENISEAGSKFRTTPRMNERTDLLHHRLDFADDVIDAHQRRLAVDAGSDVITAASLRRQRFRFVVVGAVRAARRYRPLLYMRYTTTKSKVAVVQSI